ncbi:NAD(P)/FAD-dependent oxidoreductase [Bacteriovoracales bacterium]|nr:NAD(P)/FAD-dependent oxidoreductase [Bacteriovoracales bacterium]
MKEFDILIIGSGISSMAAARILNKFGHSKIGILEQHSVPGGFLHCFKRFGHRFETGAHYIGSINRGEPFHQLLNYLDVYHEEDYIDMDDAPDDHYFEDHEYTFSLGYEENIKKLGHLFPLEKESIREYFEMVEKAAHSFPTYYFKKDYDQQKMLEYIDKTVEEVVENLFKSPKLKEILYSNSILYGVAPKDASFGFHSIVQDSYIISSKGFRFGGERLARRFVQKIEEAGGEFFFNHKVQELVIENKEITKVICQNGEIFQAKKVISGIHPKLLFDMISKNDVRKSFQKRLDQIKESNSFFGACIVLKENPGLSPLKNYYFHSSSDFDDPEEKKKQKCFPFFLTSSQRDYKEGKFPVLITSNCAFSEFNALDKKSQDYKDLKEKYFKEVLEAIEKRIPGFIESIDRYTLSSPLTNQRYVPSPTGSSYGIYHDTSCTGARGLGPRTHFHNLILTGQNTLFPGLLGGSISAIKSAGQIIGTKDILKQLSEYEVME